MQLSDGEKLILVMLSDLHKHLEIRGEVNPDLVKASINRNQLWGLRWEYEGLLNPPINTKNPPAVDETAEILQMFTWIKHSFSKLTQAEQHSVNQAVGSNANLGFPGFDGNNDEHYHIANYMIEDLGRFDEYVGANLNSHSIGSLPKYRRMLPVYMRVRRGDPMNAQELIDILNA